MRFADLRRAGMAFSEGRLSGVLSSVFRMDSTGFADLDEAYAAVETALAAVRNIRDGAFWKLLPDEQLEFGRRLEMLSRTVYAAQVHHTGEIDQLGIAKDRSCSSTQTLLRQAFTISAADAAARVKAAAQILPRELMTGGTAAPLLPELAQAVDGGCVGPEHVKIIVETMAKVPTKVGPRGAGAVRADPGGHRDRRRPQLSRQRGAADPGPGRPGWGHRRHHPRLEDGAALRQPQHENRSHADQRPVGRPRRRSRQESHRRAVRTEARRIRDDAGDAVQDVRPAGEPPGPRPDRSVGPLPGRRDRARSRAANGRTSPSPWQWDALTGLISDASFDSGAMISPAQARRFLCDAQVIPMILGSKSEVLDVGRASRTFPAHIRRAITARDKGCAWPGCDRPPDWSDGHHIEFWRRDFGATSYDNGCLLCRFSPYGNSQAGMGHPDGSGRHTGVHPAEMA